MTWILILITSAYILLIGAFVIGFFKLKKFELKKENIEFEFSIIIPFRNEALNLPKLLQSISALNYPKDLFEVLLINDESEDDFIHIVNTFKENNPNVQLKIIQNIRKSNSPKKDALNVGISNACFDWILTTDADCLIPTNWIRVYNNFIQTYDSIFVAGPVAFKKSNNWFENFQEIDFAALIGSTMGAFGIKRPFMCNGANICYKKEAFKTLNGFEGNDKLASGDDVFLLEKMIRYDSTKVYFLKSNDALIRTNAQSTLSSLTNQRVRWASKTTAYSNPFSKLVAFIVLASNVVFISILILSIVNVEVSPFNGYILISKIIIDTSIIIPTMNFTKSKFNPLYYLIIIWLQPIFTIYIALLSIFKRNYTWKNRLLK